MKPDPGMIIEECDGVYPPKEDTFLLLDSLSDVQGKRVLEMGCGSGIIALHCAKAGAEVTAVDADPKAVVCARANAERNGLELDVIVSDLFLDVDGEFDVIIFNPPYLPDGIGGGIERSWAGGEDGVRVLERFLKDAPAHLASGGCIYVLLSSMMHDAALQCALSQFMRDRLGSKKLFFEELWVESLSLRNRP